MRQAAGPSDGAVAGAPSLPPAARRARGGGGGNFLDEVWAPYQAQRFPEERLPEVLESIERLRPIASQALLGTFELTMTREVGDAFGKQLTRLARRG